MQPHVYLAFELLEVVLQIAIDQLKVAEKDPIVGKWNVVVCCGTVFVGIYHLTTNQ